MAAIILDTVETVFIGFAIDADNGNYGAHERIERIMARVGSMRVLTYAPGDAKLTALEEGGSSTDKKKTKARLVV